MSAQGKAQRWRPKIGARWIVGLILACIVLAAVFVHMLLSRRSPPETFYRNDLNGDLVLVPMGVRLSESDVYMPHGLQEAPGPLFDVACRLGIRHPADLALVRVFEDTSVEVGGLRWTRYIVGNYKFPTSGQHDPRLVGRWLLRLNEPILTEMAVSIRADGELLVGTQLPLARGGRWAQLGRVVWLDHPDWRAAGSIGWDANCVPAIVSSDMNEIREPTGVFTLRRAR